MADIQKAVEFVLRQEDASLSGISTKDSADSGGLTRFGVASKFHPELVRAGFYTCHRDEALAMAVDVYKREYADPMYLDQVKSDAVATAMLSFAILRGVAAALLTLQASLNEYGEQLVVDGSMGPKTLAAINRADARELIQTYVAKTKMALTELTVKRPSQAKWLNGWMNRCNAVLRLANAPRTV